MSVVGMNHQLLRSLVTAGLAGQPGWERHPDYDNRFRHAGTGVQIIIYRNELTVTFGKIDEGDRDDKAVAAGTAYYPRLAVASILEVAFALVRTRQQDQVTEQPPADQPDGPQ